MVNTPQVVRPDNAVTLATGRRVLFETEGPADAGQRARIIDKVLNWHAAAGALKQVKTDLQVRVLFNVKPGPPLTNVQDLWAQSIAAAHSASSSRSPSSSGDRRSSSSWPRPRGTP